MKQPSFLFLLLFLEKCFLGTWKKQLRLVAVVQPRRAFQPSITKGPRRIERLFSKDQELGVQKSRKFFCIQKLDRRTHKPPGQRWKTCKTSYVCVRLSILGALNSYLRGACENRSRIVECVNVGVWHFLLLLIFKSSNVRSIFVLLTGVIRHSCFLTYTVLPSLDTTSHSNK